MTMKALLAAKPSGAFSPDDIAGGVVWLDASDSGTITESGGAVSAWADKFNSYSFAEATNKPTTGALTQNSLNVITFDGSNDQLTYDAGSDAIDLSPFTGFMVLRISGSAASYPRPWSCRRSATGAADNDSPNALIYRNNSNNITVSTAGTGSPTDVPYTNDVFLLYEFRHDGTTVYHRKNGGTETSASATAPSNMRYMRLAADCSNGLNPPGSAVWLPCGIAEVIIYNADLSTGDRSSVRTYLNDKWAVY